MTFKDTLHPNGSKTYETFNYGYITIYNPKLVDLIEKQLSINGGGFFYAPALQQFVNDGKDKHNEIHNAFRVLD
jgi:hypothetical protein